MYLLKVGEQLHKMTIHNQSTLFKDSNEAVKIVIIVNLQIEKNCQSMLQFKTATQSLITTLIRNHSRINISVTAINITTTFVSFD